jgi:5'(3')-deoxyribonucleotidase
MNKTAILLLFLVTVFFSCSKKNENSSRPSTGKINTISVVIDDQLWNGVVGDSIRNKFAAPAEGLPKEEPQFDINQFPTDVMEGFVTKSRTIIIVKTGKENGFAIKKNQFATPQNVIHITGKSLSDLLTIIEKRTPQIIQIIKESELKAHQKLLKDTIRKSELLQKQFQLVLDIPSNYNYTIKEKNFVWLKKEFVSGSNSVMITQFPIKRINPKGDILKQFEVIHDSIGELYVKSKASSSSMYIDKSYPLYLSKTTLDGKEAFEIKGIWRLKESFMFGPFVNYLLWDTQNRRIVFLEGFCYVPSKERRDFMHELESILKGVKIN